MDDEKVWVWSETPVSLSKEAEDKLDQDKRILQV